MHDRALSRLTLATEGAATPRRSASCEDHLRMRGCPRRRGKVGWDFARSLEIVDHRRCCGMARSFRGGGRWQRLTLRPSWRIVTCCDRTRVSAVSSDVSVFGYMSYQEVGIYVISYMLPLHERSLTAILQG